MESLYITGKKRLEGAVKLCGAKNSVLPILAASLACDGVTRLENCPALSDVDLACGILRILGAKTCHEGTLVSVDTGSIAPATVPRELMGGMRGSLVFLSSELARFGRAVVHRPGGCRLGERPIDIHISLLEALGAVIRPRGDALECLLPRGFMGASLRLRYPSVGATENAIIAASRAKGLTVIEGAAREPEIEDLADYLNRCGARISGAGSDTIRIEGVGSLTACNHAVIPDRIVAATFIAFAASTGGRIWLEGAKSGHMAAVLEAFGEAGVGFEPSKDGLLVSAGRPMRSIARISCRPYPAFPTDAGPLLAAALAFAPGRSEIRDDVFENRFGFATQLTRMGAGCQVRGRSLIIEGGKLVPVMRLEAGDLRAGAALITAALGCEGSSSVGPLSYLDRGYESIETTLGRLGAEVRRVELAESE